MADGCGALVDCGPCDGGDAPKPGTLAWQIITPGVGNGMNMHVATDATGSVYAVNPLQTGMNQLRRYGVTGTLLWSRDSSDGVLSLAAAPGVDGDIALTAVRSAPGGVASIQTAFSKAGTGPLFEETSQGPNGYWRFLDMSLTGARIDHRANFVETWLIVRDGNFVRFHFNEDPSRVRFEDAVFDEHQNVIVAAHLKAPTTWGGRALATNGETHVVASFSPTGSVQWVADLGFAARIRSVDARGGTVAVVVDYLGQGTFAGTPMPESSTEVPALLLWNAAGDEMAWQRLPTSSKVLSAVDNLGNTFHAIQMAACRFDIQKRRSSDGVLLWTRTFEGSPCDALGLADMEVSSNGPLVAGLFAGTFDFGRGPITTADSDLRTGFLLRLSP